MRTILSHSVPPPSPAHWSKDFVEHLRTVHFGLISVSAGLIVIFLSAKAYKPAVALRQVHQIIELKKLWSPEWIRLKGTTFDVPSAANPNPNPNLDRFLDDNSLSTKAKMLSGTIIIHGSKVGGPQDFLLPTPVWIQEPLETADHTSISPAAFPDTLLGFQQLWDSLQTPLIVTFPDTLSSEGQIYDNVFIEIGKESGDPLVFASYVYAAKFNFISGSPGYVGDLYIIQKDSLTEPMVLRRDKDGHLIVC